MSGILSRSLILSFVFALLQFCPLLAPAQQTSSTQAGNDSLASFAGTWEGKCQDERPFVVLTLRSDGTGTVSIGNMHGDNEGACMLVTAPPAPEHAQKISGAAAHGGTLSFHGAGRPNGNFSRFQFKLTGNDTGELKLMDTPVEKHPWQLVKTNKTE